MKKIINRLLSEIDPNKALAKFGEDLRKIGVAMLGISLVGIVLVDDKVSPMQGLVLLYIGSAVWLVGIFLDSLKDTNSGNNDDKGE